MADVQKVADDVLAVVVSHGDLDKLTPEQRGEYYTQVCGSLGINPLTRPLEFIRLNGKLQLYAKKDCTDQLRRIYNVSITIVERSNSDGLATVIARATLPNGRQDEEIGATPTGKLQGEALANALMKASTKAKRRVTLSVCGLGFLDEAEIEGIPKAAIGEVEQPREGAFSLEQDKIDIFRDQITAAAEKTKADLDAFLNRKDIKDWIERLRRNNARHPKVWAEVQQEIASAYARFSETRDEGAEGLPLFAPDPETGDWVLHTIRGYTDEYSGEVVSDLQSWQRSWRNVLRHHGASAERLRIDNREHFRAIAECGEEHDKAVAAVCKMIDDVKARMQEAKQPA